MEEDLKLFPQIGAHQTLHVHKQVMRAGRCHRLLLAVPVLHLQRRGEKERRKGEELKRRRREKSIGKKISGGEDGRREEVLRLVWEELKQRFSGRTFQRAISSGTVYLS